MGEFLSGLIDIELQAKAPGADAPALRTVARGHRWPAHCRRVTACPRAASGAATRGVAQYRFPGHRPAGDGGLSRDRQGTASTDRSGGHDPAAVRPRHVAPAARPSAGFSRWAEQLRKADWPLRIKASRGRFCPASPMRGRFRTTSGRAVSGARPAMRPTSDPAYSTVRRCRRPCCSGIWPSIAASGRSAPGHRHPRRSRDRIDCPRDSGRGRHGLVESPGYGGARAALEAAGVELRRFRLDRNGLAFKGRRKDRPRLIFVTPVASISRPAG